MLKIFLNFQCLVITMLIVDCESSLSEDSAGEEVEASKCSEEYENCGYMYQTINITDSMIINATTNENYDEKVQHKTLKVHGFCCPGLICKHEGYEEEPVAAGVTHFCADPDNDLNRERMFDKWKKSLEMPPNYSY